MKYYVQIGRDITVQAIRWDRVGRSFVEQWKAIKDTKKETQPDVPAITKTLPIIKWIEAFMDHCYRCLGVRNIPLAYVIRESAAVPAVCPARETDQPYSTEHGSILGDLINRASHTHGLFPKDNAEVYFKLEEATRSTPYADSIKSFQRGKNGRGAFLAMVAQYAGKDKWEAEIKKATAVLHTRKWKASQNFTLEKFVGLHRNAFVTLTVCAEHVEYQLPNAYSRVGFVLDAIESDDAGLQAAMANIMDDTGINGKRGDFEAAVAYLLPKDPVVKKRNLSHENGGKRASADISDVSSGKAEVADFGSKPGIGKTGVHLRYHQTADYKLLSKPQQDELREWRLRKKGGGDPKAKASGSKKFRTDKAIAAAINKGIEEKLAAKEKEAVSASEQKAAILAIIHEAVSGDKKASSDATAGAATANILKGILKKAKQG